MSEQDRIEYERQLALIFQHWYKTMTQLQKIKLSELLDELQNIHSDENMHVFAANWFPFVNLLNKDDAALANQAYFSIVSNNIQALGDIALTATSKEDKRFWREAFRELLTLKSHRLQP